MMKYIFAAIVFFLSVAAHAAVDCKNATTTPELNECAAKDQQAVEDKLNTVYKRVIKNLEKDHDPEMKNVLVAAQRAWVKFREADCKAIYRRYQDGTIRTVMYLECLQTHAEKRIKFLEKNFLIPLGGKGGRSR